MSRYLLLTEKKDAARMVARALGVSTNDAGGYFAGESINITWAQGHLVEAREPDYYDTAYKEWKLDHLPILPDPFVTEVIPRHKKRVSLIKRLITSADIVINACDCGQEGEYIARLIFKHCDFDKPHKRLWYSSLQPAEIKRAFSDLRESREYDYLLHRAELRDFIDWTFGFSLTRAFTLRLSSKPGFFFTTGRVTTPTLSEIVRREHEIRSFVPRKYNVLLFSHGGLKYTSDRLPDDLKDVSGFRSFKVTKSDSKEVLTAPPRLFSLNTLQKEANKIYGYKSSKTLDLTESLYLSGLVTYPRTDSSFLPDDFDGSYFDAFFRDHGLIAAINNNNKSIFNTKKVTDHHAIVPTREAVVPSNSDEANIFNLIVSRLLAAFSSPRVSNVISVEGLSNNVRFTSRHSVIKDPGFKRFYDFSDSDSKNDEESDLILSDPSITHPAIDSVFGISPDIDARTTSAPRRYTDSSLISYMENAGKSIEAKLVSGIGTVATRAEIISKLDRLDFINYKGKNIIPSAVAIKFISAISKDFGFITLPYLTLELEKLFTSITNGDLSVSECRSLTSKILVGIINKIKASDLPVIASNTSDFNCPQCNAPFKEDKYKLYCDQCSCGVSIPFVLRGKKLSLKVISDLIAGRKTALIKGFKSKESGKSFSAFLQLNPNDSKINFSYK